MSTTYSVTRSFGDKVYGASGFDSHEDALLWVHRRAYEDGNWRPRRLREKWWQFWRPTKHNEIEKKFVG